MSMSQRNGVSVLRWSGVGSGVTGRTGRLVSGGAGEAVTTASEVGSSCWDGGDGASNPGEVGGSASRRVGAEGYGGVVPGPGAGHMPVVWEVGQG